MHGFRGKNGSQIKDMGVGIDPHTGSPFQLLVFICDFQAKYIQIRLNSWPIEKNCSFNTGRPILK